MQRRKTEALLDHLAGEREQRQRDFGVVIKTSQS
jgi:hypothetical protein